MTTSPVTEHLEEDFENRISQSRQADGLSDERDALIAALGDAVRILEAVRLSAGLSGTQLTRLSKAKSVLLAARAK